MKTFATTRRSLTTNGVKSTGLGRKSTPHGPIPAHSSAQRVRIHEILHSPRIQPKLTIGPANDAFEREADRVADQVMRMPDPAGITGRNTMINSAVQPIAPAQVGQLQRAAIYSGNILDEGSCEHLACNSKWACVDDANGVTCPAETRNAGTSRRPLFQCDSKCENNLTCSDTDTWMAIPKARFARSKCGQDLVICANGNFTHAQVRDGSNRQAWEVGHGIQDDLGVSPYATFRGAIYANENDAAFKTDRRCRPPTPSPTTQPSPSTAPLPAQATTDLPDPTLQRTCACGGTCADCREHDDEVRTLRPTSDGSASLDHAAAPPIVHEVLASPGQPLDAATRAFMEARFGNDFSKVRIHTGASATKAADAVAAKAFTVGQDAVFGRGQFAPETDSGLGLLAHELTHVVQQSGTHSILQRAETDTVPGCAVLTDTEPDVNAKVNASLAEARLTAGTPPAGTAVADNLANNLGRDVTIGRTAIEAWASSLPATKASLPAQSATKYAGVTFGLWWQRSFPILNPTMKINSICVGSDKLGHFFQQGATFRETEASIGRAAAEEESERSEGGGFGLGMTGVFSNADREANRQGAKFYKDLIAGPSMTFAIRDYISPKWSEVENPNFYQNDVGRQVWANILTRTWMGTSWAGVPLLHEELSVTLSATAAGSVTGTFSVMSTPGPVPPPVGNIRGTITHNTTTVRGQNPLGFDTNPTPISGVHIEFDWTLGSNSGKGFLDSSGERRLTGRWGRGASNTDLGAWDIRL